MTEEFSKTLKMNRKDKQLGLFSVPVSHFHVSYMWGVLILSQLCESCQSAMGHEAIVLNEKHCIVGHETHLTIVIRHSQNGNKENRTTAHVRARVPMCSASEPEVCTKMWRVKVGTLLSKLCLSHFFHQIASVLEQVWLKSCGWKGRQPRRRWPTLIWAALKTIILLSTSTQTILSKWSCSRVSTMWLEIIVRGSQPTWIQDEELTESKQSKHSFWNHGKTFSRLWWEQTKRGVFTLFGSYCYCTICLIHSFNCCLGVLTSVWKGRGNSSQTPSFPQRWRSY